MVFQYILMSLLFAFVYWWYIGEERLERHVYLAWYIINGSVGIIVYGLAQARIALAILMIMFIIHWWVGFHYDRVTIRGSE